MNQEETTPEKMYCYHHPDRETRLRCNRCNQPICASCAFQTPTGYRCQDCIRIQQKVYDTTKSSDYVTASLIALVISFAGSWTAGLLGFFTILISPFVGFLIAEIVRWAIKKRRSKALNKITMIAAAVGSLPLLIYISVLVVSNGGAGFPSLIWQAVYTTIIASAVYYRLGGARMRI